ncbi:dihydrodipicolinate reductase [Pelomyxa schiedti]|nr:dihydrodipicolinate reductase [Pelomyxa schiedti]
MATTSTTSSAARRVETLTSHLLSGGMPNGPIRVVQIGLGPIGQRMVRDIAARKNLVLVAAIDANPAILGRNVYDLCSVTGSTTTVTVSPPSAIGTVPAHVAVVTTVSELVRLFPLLKQCIKAKLNVVSTCEELSFPFHSHPELARQIDALAKANNVSVLGTGINPGFLMDALPVFMSTLCRSVRSINVQRHQDSRIRRLPFQKKIGCGLTLPEWMKLRDAGKIKHVGFAQSLNLIASAFGWELDKIEDIVEPVIAEKDVSSPLLKVPAGTCCGVRQYGYGYIKGERRIVLEMHAYNGHPNPCDTVNITGDPDVTSTIIGGVNGDISTCAIICNTLSSVVASHPGLRTMVDISLPHWNH